MYAVRRDHGLRCGLVLDAMHSIIIPKTTTPVSRKGIQLTDSCNQSTPIDFHPFFARLPILEMPPGSRFLVFICFGL